MGCTVGRFTNAIVGIAAIDAEVVGATTASIH